MEVGYTLASTKNCMDEDVYYYTLASPLNEDIKEYLEEFGEVIYTFGPKLPCIKLQNPDMLFTANLGQDHVRLMVKKKAQGDIKGKFEERLRQYISSKE